MAFSADLAAMPIRPLSSARTSSPAPGPVEIRDTDRRIRDVLPLVLRQLPLGVAVIRSDRTVAYGNDEFARLIRADGAALGRLEPMRRTDGSPHEPGDEPLEQVLRTSDPPIREHVQLVGADGSQVRASLTMAPIVEPSGHVLGAVLYVEDLSDDEEEASLRDAFAGVLSHELRTPITAIYGGAQLLRQGRVPADAREGVLEDIAAEADHLHRLVEDLLAIARIGADAPPLAGEPVLLQRVAAQVAMAEERRWPGHRVEVRAPADLPAVRGDDGYLIQVLRNLIFNAVKYSPIDEPVVVELAAHGDEVSATVLDRGPGFPPGTGPDAFRLFYRSPAVAARLSGTGIGLFVASALVEAHGGRIWLRERPGGGSEVGFSLPVYGARDAASDASEAPVPHG